MKYTKTFEQYNILNEETKPEQEIEIGDDIIFVNFKWDHKNNKNIITHEKGKVIDIVEYNDDTWGSLNVRVVPDRKELCDKEGGLWIAQHRIVKQPKEGDDVYILKLTNQQGFPLYLVSQEYFKWTTNEEEATLYSDTKSKQIIEYYSSRDGDKYKTLRRVKK